MPNDQGSMWKVIIDQSVIVPLAMLESAPRLPRPSSELIVPTWAFWRLLERDAGGRGVAERFVVIAVETRVVNLREWGWGRADFRKWAVAASGGSPARFPPASGPNDALASTVVEGSGDAYPLFGFARRPGSVDRIDDRHEVAARHVVPRWEGPVNSPSSGFPATSVIPNRPLETVNVNVPPFSEAPLFRIPPPSARHSCSPASLSSSL